MQTKRKNKPGAGRPVGNWTPERIKLLKRLYPGNDNATAARQLGVSVFALCNAATRFGVKKQGWSEKEISVLKAHYNTLTYQQIADKIGKTKWAVINKARDLELTPIK